MVHQVLHSLIWLLPSQRNPGIVLSHLRCENLYVCLCDALMKRKGRSRGICRSDLLCREKLASSLKVSNQIRAVARMATMRLESCRSVGLKEGDIPSVMLIETSVFSTIFVNSSKLILPSRSRSASIIVLSTICTHHMHQ